jgi:D-alanyl-D-alanine carboxypeptidase/D-alanyl-D-alanine-endopeptidase (penicillin-binding protein 4)
MGRWIQCVAILATVCPVVSAQGVGCDGAVAATAGRSGACTELARQVDALLADPLVSRAHWGIDVTAMDGTPIYSLNEGQFFQPASNAKLYTTVTALALLGPEKTFETQVVAEGTLGAGGVLQGDLVLKGGGDANFGSVDLPYVAPAQRPKNPQPGVMVGDGTIPDIETLADAVVAKGLREVQGDVVGDDTKFSWEPIPPDWANDDLIWGYGAPVSALTIHHNQVDVHVGPNPVAGQKAEIQVDPSVPYYTVTNNVFTADFGRDCDERLLFEKAPGSKSLVVTGDIPPKATPCVEDIAIDDPAEYAALALKSALERRGVRVTGGVKVRHWNPERLGSFLPKDVPDPILQQRFESPKLEMECQAQAVAGPERPAQTVLATHQSAPLIEDMTLTNKVSQNLHAELFLRNVGAAYSCQPDARESLRVVRQYLLHVGLDKDDFVFYDGSGLSGHDLVTPRATARLLQFASTQLWFAEWKATLPVGGVDGSLAARFPKAPLKEKVFAKTGTLDEARALSGYLECASGKTVIFTIMVGNHAPGTSADRETMDKIVAAIAAAN